MRVIGHNLACETGRWNRRGRGRLLLEERVRVCPCGDVQTEQHFIEQCSLTQRIRELYQFPTITKLFSERLLPEIVCKITHEILNILKE